MNSFQDTTFLKRKWATSTHGKTKKNSGKRACPVLLPKTLRSCSSCFAWHTNNKAMNGVTNPISWAWRGSPSAVSSNKFVWTNIARLSRDTHTQWLQPTIGCAVHMPEQVNCLFANLPLWQPQRCQNTDFPLQIVKKLGMERWYKGSNEINSRIITLKQVFNHCHQLFCKPYKAKCDWHLSLLLRFLPTQVKFH